MPSTGIAKRRWGDGRFEILRELGAGGMGVVYEAIDHELGVPVALKTLQRMDADSLLRFKREFRALQDIHHDNLVRLGELFEEEGVWFFTMELVAGVDLFEHVCPTSRARGAAQKLAPEESRSVTKVELRALLDRLAQPEVEPPRPHEGHAFDEPRLRAAFRQLARALVRVHAARKVHRDIKPSNLLVGPEGRVVVLDFGLIAEASQAPEDAIVGTAAYMAPEQALAEAVGPAADWYSVGAVLFLTLTGRTPFVGSTDGILAQKLSTSPPRPRDFGARVPVDLDALCAGLLAMDPSARPDAEQVLRAFGVRSVPPTIGDGPGEGHVFVGRAREMDTIGRAFDRARARAGDASVLLVSGESGVGKTALVRAFLSGLAAREPRALVVSGRCYERESVPYKAVDDAMDAVTAHLASWPEAEVVGLVPRDVALLGRVFPVLRRVPAMKAAMDASRAPAIADPQQTRARVFAAVRELFGGLARRRGALVLSIDDLQWADVDSLALLAEVLRGPEPPPLFLIATVRGVTGEGAARSLAELGSRLSHAREVLELAPLARDDARALIESLLAGEGPERAGSAEAIAAEAGGHPMFIEALVRHRPARDAGASVHLDDMLWQRAASLEEPALALLRVVALAGAPIPQDAAAEVAALSAADLARLADVLRAAQLVRSSGPRSTDTIEPYHDRVRETVIARTGEAARARCHLGLAGALESRGADPETLGNHWRAAGDRPRALAHYLAAAEHATAVLAFDRAARLLAIAIELLPEKDARAPELRTLRGDALANAGRGRDASEAYLAAVADPRSTAGIELRRRACEQLLRSGHFDEGIKLARELLGELHLSYPRSPTHALLSLLFRRAQIRLRGFRFAEREPAAIPPSELARIDTCWTATIGLGMTDLVRGNDFQTRHLLLALRAGEPYRVAKALAVEAGYLSTAGVPGLAHTVRVCGLARNVAERTGHPHAIGLAILFDGYRAFLMGAWSEARSIMETAERHLREQCTGVAWELTNAQLLCAWALGFLGEVRLLSERLPEYVREARERGDLFAMANLRNGLPNIHWLARDDVDGARREIDEVMRDWSEDGFHLQHYYAMHARTDIELYAGDVRAAQAHMDRDWPGFVSSLLERVQVVKLNAIHVRARCALASAAAARDDAEQRAFLKVAGECAGRLEKDALAWSTALADLVRAGHAAVRRDAAAEVGRLRRAREGFLSAGMRLHAAAAERRLGRAVGGEEGRALRAVADEWFAGNDVKDASRLVAAVAPGFAPDD